MKLLSIIIPTYNMAALLPRCLDSLVAAQHADLLDILVVNDGSKDDSSAVGHRYEAQHPGVYKAITIPKRPERLVGFLLTRISYAYNFYRYNAPITLHNIVCYCLYPFSYVWHKAILWLLSRGGKPFYCCQMGEGVYKQPHPTRYADIFPLREIEFEGHTFMAPNNPDGYLRAIYKDYWRIPSPEKRRVHGAYYIKDATSISLQYNETDSPHSINNQ